MSKRWKGYAAAALTASLTVGLIGTTYGGTLTLAGFGADQAVEETKEQPKKEAAKKETANADTAKKEAAAETKAETQTEAPKAETQTEAPKAETQTEAPKAETQTEAPQAEAQTEAPKAEAQTEVPQTEAQTEAPQTEAQTEPPIDRSMVDTTGFAKAEDYINVRASGDTEGEVVGTLSLNDSVYIEDVDENGWYKVRSGNVEGYVAGYLIATGEEAEQVAKDSGYTYATVGAESLNVRSDASEDSEVVDMVGQDSNLEVVEDLGDWVKVVTNDGVYGYVSSAFVNTETVYSTGETVQEQSEREEAEYAAYVAQQESEYAAYVAQQEAEYAAYLAQSEAEAAAAGYTETGYTDPAAAGYTEAGYTDPAAAGYAETTYTDPAATQTASASSSDVDALYQAYLVAQDAAMTPTDEADATAKANAAIDAYNAYLAACGSTQTVAAVETATTADTTTAATDTTAVDNTAAEAAYTETAYTEAAQTEAAPAESTGSGLGSQIANYATQFVGNPYVYGGSSLTGGADCSGFTMAVYSNFGIGLPHNAAAQSGCGQQVSLSDLQPGDLLFYDNGGGIGHVAMYIGGGSVVHASNPETGIKISSYNYRTPVSAVRLV